MNDPLNKVESELAALRPRPLPAQLVDRIGAALIGRTRMSIADRCLASFMGAGALAACIIVGLLVWQSSESTTLSRMPSPQMSAFTSSSIGQYQQLLARSSDVMSEMTP